MNHTEASRKVVVESVSTFREVRESPGFPSDAFEDGDAPPEIWRVSIRVREGMKPETSRTHLCLSAAEAAAIVAAHPVGSELPEQEWNPFKRLGGDFIRGMIDAGGIFLGAGDEDLFLTLDVLSDAGIIDSNNYETSRKVLDCLGKPRVEELKARFGENWSVAAEFEYCLQEMPHSSAAYVAAASRFHYFISNNDFAAGYLLRDLEVLVHGVEAVATKSIEMRKNAGAAGSKKSAKARQVRRTALLTAMEDVARRNPDIVSLGEASLINLALRHASDIDPGLWRQGKGQAAEYVGEIRRGEAGAEMQARLSSLLGTKPLKRLGRLSGTPLGGSKGFTKPHK